MPLMLPSQPTAFVPRPHDLERVLTILSGAECRLLTLIGMGGVGKSRLALEAALARQAHYRDGVIFVPLQGLASTEYLIAAIAERLNFQFHDTGDAQTQLVNYLREKQLLLLLDNFEHLLDGATIVADLLAGAPLVQLLITSREALKLQEEWWYAVGGMDYPASAETYQEAAARGETFGAIQLFAQTAQRLHTDFDLSTEINDLIRICHLVEGAPLALELAAGWTRALSCADIAREITHNLDFLATSARNAPERHRSMRVVLEQSWMRLTPDEQNVFKRLAVFRGGFTREAAQATAGASPLVLAALVDHALLRRGERYELHELLRQYAAEQLSPEALRQTQDAHSAYYCEFLGGRWQALGGAQQQQMLREIETEIENIRAALRWAVEQRHAPQIARAMDSLWFFYDTRSWYQEGERAFGSAAAAFESEVERLPVLYGGLLARQGSMYYSLNQPERAEALLNHAVALLEPTGDKAALAFALLKLGETAQRVRHMSGEPLFRRALELYQELGDQGWVAYTLNWLMTFPFIRRDFPETLRMIQESLALSRAVGNEWGVGQSLERMTWIMMEMGELEQALGYAEAFLAICEKIGLVWGQVLALNDLAAVLFRLGQHAPALEHTYRSIRIAREHGLIPSVLDSIDNLAFFVAQAGRSAQAVELLSLIHHHPMNWETAYGAINALRDLRKQMPLEVYEAAFERGKKLNLDMLLNSLLEDWDVETQQLLTELRHTRQLPAQSDLLNTRELEILGLLASGKSNREIAETLIFSVGTVKWYINQIYGKLHVGSRTQAIARARELALLT